jgi:RHS repeat-associated protein
VEVSSSAGKFVADAIRWVEIVEPVAKTIESTDYIHFDHLGTPRQVTDKDQKLVWRWDSSPFGDLLPDEDPDGDTADFTLNLRFPGQYYDAESGLHYNYFRTYDPATGRFIESDPLGLEGGMNTFAYAYQNPLGLLDPSGLLVTGEWIQQPRFNLVSYGIDKVEWNIGTASPWGQLGFFRVFGYVSGFINIDVACMNSNECGNSKWDIHEQIEVFYQGSTDVGPNAYASIAGRALGLYGWAVANILAAGGSALNGGLELLRAAEQKAGAEIALFLDLGPNAICLASRRK